jgi:glycosyltransferase involved in cell wall biosynthesis
VNGRFLSQAITGVQRYAYELLTALDALLTSREIEPVPVTILVPPDAKAFPAWSTLRIQQAGRFTGQLWEQFDLAFHARGSLLFTPCGGAPVLHDRHVITIHDAGTIVTPAAYTATYRTYYKLLNGVLSRKASHILTLSQFSKNELMRVLGLPESKISYAWLSGEHILRVERDDSVIARNGLTNGRYVLAVGSRNPNKNLDGLIAAMSFLQDTETTLAIAGGGNSKIFGDGGETGGQIRELGFVSDSELRSLYEHAACFVFPSFYEGFGLPPLEALTLGTPVVVSRVASLPEVFGDAALYCDPHSPEDIANQISKVLMGQGPRKETSLEHASTFTWARCARETWAILLRALD